MSGGAATTALADPSIVVNRRLVRYGMWEEFASGQTWTQPLLSQQFLYKVGASLNHETGRAQLFQQGRGCTVGKHNPRQVYNDFGNQRPSTALAEFLDGGTA